MKKIRIKGRVTGLTPSAPILAALIGAAVLLPLRIRQLSSNTDLSTGFFIERDIFVYAFFAVCVLASVATVALSYLCGKMPSNEVAQVKRPVCAITSLLMAAGFGFESLKILRVLQAKAKEDGLSLYESSVANESLRDLLECALGGVAMVAFVLLSVACLCGKFKWLKFPAILFLAAPLWGVLRVISYFTYTISYLVIAELFCEMYACVCLMLFLFSIARFFTETGSEGSIWAVVASGLLSALFCLLASIPRLFTTVLGLGTAEGFGIDWIFAAGGVFSITSVLSVVTKGIEEKKTEDSVPVPAGEDGDIPVEPFTVE